MIETVVFAAVTSLVLGMFTAVIIRDNTIGRRLAGKVGVVTQLVGKDKYTGRVLVDGKEHVAVPSYAGAAGRKGVFVFGPCKESWIESGASVEIVGCVDNRLLVRKAQQVAS